MWSDAEGMAGPPQLLILAGGRGTRLAGHLADVPKALAPVGGKPFLEHQLAFAASQQISDVVLCLGYRHEAIVEQIGDGRRFGLHVAHSVEAEPLDTAGAVRQALHLVRGTFYVMNGDTWFDAPWLPLLQAHRQTRAVATIAAVSVDDTTRYGRLSIASDGRVEGFSEKDVSGPGLISAGLYILEPQVIESVPQGVRASFEHDLFPALVRQHKLYAHPMSGFHLDIGTPGSLAAAQMSVGSAVDLTRIGTRLVQPSLVVKNEDGRPAS